MVIASKDYAKRLMIKDKITAAQVELIRQAVIRQMGGRAAQDKKHAFPGQPTKP